MKIMEQKRTLWIIAAVGVFLLFVLGAAMIIYKPAISGSPMAASSSSQYSNGWISLEPQSSPVTSYDYGKSYEDGYPYQEDLAKNDFSSESGESADLKVDSLTVYSENANVYSANKVTTIDLIKTDPKEDKKIKNTEQYVGSAVGKSVSATDYSYSADNSAKSSAGSKKSAYQPAKTAEKKVSYASPVSSKEKLSSSSRQVEKTSGKAYKTVTNYWVQVSALKSRKNADNARDILDQNKIPADVFTITTENNEIRYRVRVGPYVTSSEAEYWREKINKIEAFAGTESFVVSTKSNE